MSNFEPFEDVDELILKVAEAKTDNFIELMSLAGLDPLTDLEGADLANTDLKGIHLEHANLRECDLRGADLFDASLIEADLSGAKLIEADLSGAKLMKANLSEANLSWANLSGAYLMDANLMGANLTEAFLTWADLSRADMRGSVLRKTVLEGADLSGADLTKADFMGAYLVDVKLPDAVSEIKGEASSRGVAEGPARVVIGLSEIVNLQPGEILVCASTSHSWVPVFTKIKAAVTDIGGLTSHAAIVCREYGVPSVTGTGVATSVIKTGDVIKVDGDTGFVNIVKKVG